MTQSFHMENTVKESLKVRNANTLLAYFCGLDKDSSALYDNADFRYITQVYQTSIEQRHYLTILDVLYKHVHPSSAAWISFMDDILLDALFSRYMLQYATQHTAMEYRQQSQQLSQDSIPAEWLESMVDYDKIWQDVQEHAASFVDALQDDTVSFVEQDDGSIIPLEKEPNATYGLIQHLPARQTRGLFQHLPASGV